MRSTEMAAALIAIKSERRETNRRFRGISALVSSVLLSSLDILAALSRLETDSFDYLKFKRIQSIDLWRMIGQQFYLFNTEIL